jgi:hypothetical protein
MAVTYTLLSHSSEPKTVPRQVKHRSAKAKRRDQAGRRNVTPSCQCGGGRIQASGRSERWRVFGRGRIEEVRRCAGRFERAVTMVHCCVMRSTFSRASRLLADMARVARYLRAGPQARCRLMRERPTAYIPVAPGERRRLLSFTRFQISCGE